MPTDTERRLEALENVLLFGGGVAAGTASGRHLAAAAVRKAPAAGLGLARRYPAATVVALGYTAHRLGLGPIETAERRRQALRNILQRNSQRRNVQLARQIRPSSTQWTCLKVALKPPQVRTKASYQREPSK